jgi:transcriptional regulator with XRE-family HTH domain
VTFTPNIIRRMANTSKRLFDNRIADILGGTIYSLNAISRRSGISHTYLSKLVQGSINHPGKDKIASILLALNYPITAINSVLAEYDYLPLDERDIPALLDNNRRRIIDGNTLPLYDRIYVRLLLSCMERRGGTKIVVRPTPSVLFMPAALYHKDDAHFEDNDEAKTFYQDFAHALFVERKRTFLESIRNRGQFYTYICKDCLEEYLGRNLRKGNQGSDLEHRTQVMQFFANAMGFVQRNPNQHRITISSHCPYFLYQIQDADVKSARVFYLGKAPHNHSRSQDRMNLHGFVSANPAKVDLFIKETDLCREAAFKELLTDYPRSLIEYLHELFAAHGLDAELSAAIRKVAESGEMY